MKKEIIKKLKDFFSSEDNQILAGKPATDEQIRNAEELLGVKFSEDYIEFIKLFGGAYAGLDIHAFENGKALGKETVIELTGNMRISHPEVKDTYVISDDGAGNPIMINSKGEVEIFYHDSGEVETLAASLSEFIEENFEPW
ncbi:SMI1/KNR4 family protein [Dysgonomonas sp. 521]|uniref:SMI1/KNR4 family protein n=1 Tax=Dysgonomonas sp. 521 TaxID=2302932 RepID=UPI0013D29BC8|nr:SMI1/KNR4 family protein [Dysgonomonas sp. 521]NDV94593.1 SMI1/KNR4 family protein [Dysgonomonas sp. 521]